MRMVGSSTELRRRCRNLCCTKPRGTSAGYGYLIQFVAAQLRGSTKGTHRASLGMTANGAFCKLRGLLIGDFAASTAVLAIVLPAETDMGRVEMEQTAVGDRDAMGVAREIGQDLLRTGEG